MADEKLEVGQVWYSRDYNILRVVQRIEGKVAHLVDLNREGGTKTYLLTAKGTVNKRAPLDPYWGSAASQAGFYDDFSLVAEGWQGTEATSVPSPSDLESCDGFLRVVCPKSGAKVECREVKKESYTFAEYARHYLACGK